MTRKRITIRLYKRHDLDLISFIQTHHMDFQKAVYCALTAFVKGEVFVIKLPPKVESLRQIEERYIYTLKLNSATDQAVLNMLDDINDQYRNCFIKNILRLYLCMPISSIFLKNEDKIGYYEAQFAIFKQNRRLADAARVKDLAWGRGVKNDEDRMTDIFTEGELPVRAVQKKHSATKPKKRPVIEEENKAEPGSGSGILESYPVIPEPVISSGSNKALPDPESPDSNISDSELTATEDLTDLFASMIAE